MIIKIVGTLLQMVHLSYGMESENPMDRVLFYKKEKPDETFLIPREKVTTNIKLLS